MKHEDDRCLRERRNFEAHSSESVPRARVQSLEVVRLPPANRRKGLREAAEEQERTQRKMKERKICAEAVAFARTEDKQMTSEARKLQAT